MSGDPVSHGVFVVSCPWELIALFPIKGCTKKLNHDASSRGDQGRSVFFGNARHQVTIRENIRLKKDMNPSLCSREKRKSMRECWCIVRDRKKWGQGLLRKFPETDCWRYSIVIVHTMGYIWSGWRVGRHGRLRKTDFKHRGG
jgi:hypothetical protein